MATAAQRQATETTGEHLSINLAGPPDIVQRLLAAMAGSIDMESSAPNQQEPEPLLLSRQDAAKRSGLSPDKISILVKQGKLPNHGGPGRMLLSLADIRAWQETQH